MGCQYVVPWREGLSIDGWEKRTEAEFNIRVRVIRLCHWCNTSVSVTSTVGLKYDQIGMKLSPRTGNYSRAWWQTDKIYNPLHTTKPTRRCLRGLYFNYRFHLLTLRELIQYIFRKEVVYFKRWLNKSPPPQGSKFIKLLCLKRENFFETFFTYLSVSYTVWISLIYHYVLQDDILSTKFQITRNSRECNTLEKDHEDFSLQKSEMKANMLERKDAYLGSVFFPFIFMIICIFYGME
jgi:hypothetical protein